MPGLYDFRLGEHVGQGGGGLDRFYRLLIPEDLEASILAAASFPNEGNGLIGAIQKCPVEGECIADDADTGPRRG